VRWRVGVVVAKADSDVVEAYVAIVPSQRRSASERRSSATSD
jgi:hypothetical protein